MTERHSIEVAKVLLHISEARTRAGKGADVIAKDGADEHLVEALREAEQTLAELHRRVSQGTYYAVADEALRLSF